MVKWSRLSRVWFLTMNSPSFRLGHPNVVHLEEVLKDELHTYVVTELLSGGELLEQIRRRTSFTEAEASLIMRQLSDAVHFIHSKVRVSMREVFVYLNLHCLDYTSFMFEIYISFSTGRCPS